MAKAECVVKYQYAAVVAYAFGHHVHAGDAEIYAALVHADDDVARPLEEHGQPRQSRDVGGVLAWVGLIHRQAAGSQKLQRCLGEAAFAGQ